MSHSTIVVVGRVFDQSERPFGWRFGDQQIQLLSPAEDTVHLGDPPPLCASARRDDKFYGERALGWVTPVNAICCYIFVCIVVVCRVFIASWWSVAPNAAARASPSTPALLSSLDGLRSTKKCPGQCSLADRCPDLLSRALRANAKNDTHGNRTHHLPWLKAEAYNH